MLKKDLISIVHSDTTKIKTDKLLKTEFLQITLTYVRID
jgi:hypothetical protein